MDLSFTSLRKMMLLTLSRFEFYFNFFSRITQNLGMVFVIFVGEPLKINWLIFKETLTL